MKLILSLSLLLNIIFIGFIVYIYRNKKKMDHFREVVEDIEAFKSFFNSEHIDF